MIALDTNVLVYAEGVNGIERRTAALALLAQLPEAGVFLPVQVLGELFNVLVRKDRRSGSNARSAILAWRDVYPLIPTSPTTMIAALDLAANHNFSIWDAAILAAAADAGCRLLLSEDMRDGFIWRGVTITNPFRENRAPLLAGRLRPRSG